ncbi:MAG TPA: EthD domain-containing protein [Candidatus Binataceae bacterium]|nr:EthD domain-containing protein [Candidatus Binataceae bacterium]
MIKLIICASRRADITAEQFDTYWRDKHGPLVKSVTEFSRHVRKYVQCHLVESPVPFGIPGAYDGVAELWFDSVDEAKKAFSEPKYLEIIRADELKFVDPHRCISFVTEELEVI